MSGEMSFSEAFETVKAERELSDLLESTLAFEQQVSGMLNQIGNQVTNLFVGLLDGTKELEDELSNLLGQIGRLLIQFGLSTLGGNDGRGLFSFLSGNLFRAEGGPVNAGRPYIVGEKGPELMVPSSSGSVVDTQTTAAALSRFSPGNSYNPFQPEGNRASDGTSRRVSGAGTTFTLQTTVINGVEYATVDQVRAMGMEASKAGAKQGEAAALRKLQMSSSTRRRLGM